MLLIKDGTLYTMESEEPVCADLLMKDGKIIRISKHITRTSDMEVIDARGMWVLPGFIDAHSHIGLSEEKTGVPGDDCNETTNPVTPTLRAIDAINPLDSAFHNALAEGITGVMAGPGSSNVIGGQFAFIKTFGRRVDDMVVLAPAAIKIAFGENPKTNYGENGQMPGSRMGTAALIRKGLFRAKQYFEKINNLERKLTAEKRRILEEKTKRGDFQTLEEETVLKKKSALEEQLMAEKDFGLESYRELFEGKIPLKAHAHRTDDIFTAIRIAREFGLDLTLDHCTEGHLIAEELAEFGYPAIVGPAFASRSKNEVSLADFKTAGILKKAGVSVALTTDHPVSRIQYLPLCAALSAIEGLGEYNALRAITLDAAKICKVDHRVGSLKEGKDADVIIYDGNPLEILSKLKVTIINGRIVWSDKEY